MSKLLDIYIQIGNRLREARIQSGHKTSASFAEKIGVNKPTYSNHECGNRAMSIETVIEYAKHLHISWEYLITGNEVYKNDISMPHANYTVNREFFDNVLSCVDDILLEKNIKLQNKEKIEIIHGVYNIAYKRYLDNPSRFSTKDIRMCIETALEFSNNKIKKGL